MSLTRRENPNDRGTLTVRPDPDARVAGFFDPQTIGEALEKEDFDLPEMVGILVDIVRDGKDHHKLGAVRELNSMMNSALEKSGRIVTATQEVSNDANNGDPSQNRLVLSCKRILTQSTRPDISASHVDVTPPASAQ